MKKVIIGFFILALTLLLTLLAWLPGPNEIKGCVKTSMFNGVPHPSIGIWTEKDKFKLVREFKYKDYKNRLS